MWKVSSLDDETREVVTETLIGGLERGHGRVRRVGTIAQQCKRERERLISVQCSEARVAALESLAHGAK